MGTVGDSGVPAGARNGAAHGGSMRFRGFWDKHSTVFDAWLVAAAGQVPNLAPRFRLSSVLWSLGCNLLAHSWNRWDAINSVPWFLVAWMNGPRALITCSSMGSINETPFDSMIPACVYEGRISLLIHGRDLLRLSSVPWYMVPAGVSSNLLAQSIEALFSSHDDCSKVACVLFRSDSCWLQCPTRCRKWDWHGELRLRLCMLC